jgi:hypothetical protein
MGCVRKMGKNTISAEKKVMPKQEIVMWRLLTTLHKKWNYQQGYVC